MPDSVRARGNVRKMSAAASDGSRENPRGSFAAATHEVGDGGGDVPTNPFDKACRYCVQSDPIGFIRWLIPGISPTLKFRGWLDTRTLPFPGSPDRTCDTVAELAEDGVDAVRRAL